MSIHANVRLSLRTTAAPKEGTGGHWENTQNCNNNFLLLCTTGSTHCAMKPALLTISTMNLWRPTGLQQKRFCQLAKKPKQHKYQNHSQIVKARKKVAQLTKRYNTQKSRVVRKHLKEAKESLQQLTVRFSGARLQMWSLTSTTVTPPMPGRLWTGLHVEKPQHSLNYVVSPQRRGSKSSLSTSVSCLAHLTL